MAKRNVEGRSVRLGGSPLDHRIRGAVTAVYTHMQAIAKTEATLEQSVAQWQRDLMRQRNKLAEASAMLRSLLRQKTDSEPIRFTSDAAGLRKANLLQTFLEADSVRRLPE